jgi:hypothetical protein
MANELIPERLLHILPSHIIDRIVVADLKPGQTRGPCWEFRGDPSSNGYMRCWYGGNRYMAHRLIYELHFKKDIRKWQLDHLCENRPCCNPDHMDPVTPKINALRRTKRRKKA